MNLRRSGRGSGRQGDVLLLEELEDALRAALAAEAALLDAAERGRGVDHSGMLHRPLIALLGMAMGELWKLDELAEACAADGVYDFFVTCKPLNIVGAVGSPPNAIAIK